ncbi:MAG TPA: peptidylprolyl isomerase [Burkholderiales bacterium]|jgi:peptidyl-prolyl cis-trans isomerase C|nr:peptidylprolyl isomerase [Burkholderiales bacterium]
MNRYVFALALALPGLAAAQLPGKEPAKAGAKPAASASGPVATVNGVAIPRTRLETVLRMQKDRGVADSDQVRAQLREILINNELLNQEANRTGLVKKAEFQQQLELARNEVIANAMIQEHLRTHPVAAADVQKEYDKLKAQQGDKEYKVRHILLAKEDEAKAVIAEIKKGAKFEDVAQKKSLDEGTRPRGGELEWTVPGNLEKPFADAMVKLEKGKMTETPVATRYGFHVVKVDDIRDVKFPDITQVRGQLEQRLLGQRVEAFLRDLRAKAKID